MEETLKISFGAIESPEDPRTYTADMMATSAPVIPQEKKIALDYNHVNDLCNQLRLGVCTMCAVRMAAENHFKDGVRLDEYWGYLIGKTMIDDPMYGEHFEGSSAFTMLKASNKYGIPTKDIQEEYPLKLDGTYKEFIDDFNSRYHGQVPEAVMVNASAHKIAGYYKVDKHPSLIAAEINKGRVLVGRFVTGDNFYADENGNKTRLAKKLLPLRVPKYIYGGHLMAINEYYNGVGQTQMLAGPNSWSRSWCPDNKDQEAGYYNFSFSQLNQYFTEVWAIMDEDEEFRYTFNRDLIFGERSKDVVALQKVLKQLGYFPNDVNATGFYGPITATAVWNYQIANKVASYPELSQLQGSRSRVGPKTRRSLNSLNN